MNEYWLMLFLTLVLEIVAIAVVSVFGMTFSQNHMIKLLLMLKNDGERM